MGRRLPPPRKQDRKEVWALAFGEGQRHIRAILCHVLFVVVSSCSTKLNILIFLSPYFFILLKTFGPQKKKKEKNTKT